MRVVRKGFAGLGVDISDMHLELLIIRHAHYRQASGNQPSALDAALHPSIPENTRRAVAQALARGVGPDCEDF